jgi:soluble lytic murein transglycosylase
VNSSNLPPSRQRRWQRHPFTALASLAVMMLLVPAGTALASRQPAASEPAAVAEGDRLIVQAKEAFQKSRLPELERLTAKSQQHPLAAWPDYWRLKLLMGLPSISPQALQAHVEAFTSRHASHPLKETAQREWVAALISQGLWADAGAALTSLPDTLTSPQITCAKARLGLLPIDGQTGAAGFESLAIGNETSDGCIGLIELLANSDAVSPNYLRYRARWAAQVGNDSSHRRLMDIFREHAKVHDLGARGSELTSSEVTLGRILSIGRVNNLGALEAFKKQGASLSQEQRRYASFAVGAVLWRRSHPDAWSLMQEGWASHAQQPTETLQIAAREAIRRSEWAKLLDLLAAMREPAKNEPTWRYWQAIALKEMQQPAQAQAILKDLRDDFGFYGVLAKETLGEAVIIPAAQPAALSADDRQRLDRDAGIQRSYALLRLGLRSEALTEWSAAMRSRSDQELLRAAVHARDNGFLDRMIAAADRTRQTHDFSLRYPAAFKDTVLPAAKNNAIDPWWVLGLIRQESRFIPDIRSSVGASGLMQIMPATGKMLAKNIGLRQSGNLQLADVELNIQLGTTYMRQLQDRFDGSALLASAAYNAGPSRAILWRSALPGKLEGAAFAESIPFAETRDYVKRVLTNTVLYQAVHVGGPAPSLKTLLGDIIPRGSL